MAEPSRIRAQVKDGVTEVHVLMIHPMETGFRKDDAGNVVPAHYITDVEISLAGRLVLSATLSRAVAEDPLLYFRIRGGRAGDKIVVAWIDTAGDRRTDEGTVARA